MASCRQAGSCCFAGGGGDERQRFHSTILFSVEQLYTFLLYVAFACLPLPTTPTPKSEMQWSEHGVPGFLNFAQWLLSLLGPYRKTVHYLLLGCAVPPISLDHGPDNGL